jgi:hypothetical protein
MTVLFLFYGGGKPEDMLEMIGEAVQQQQKVALVRIDESEAEPLKLKKATASSLENDASIARVKKTPNNITPAKAQQNLLQQYVQAIRPVVEKQVNLPENAPRLSNAGQGEFSFRSNHKPNTLMHKKPRVAKKAATTVSDKPKAAASPNKAGGTTLGLATSAAHAAPILKILASKPTPAPKIGAGMKSEVAQKRPPNGRTFSSTSTVHPGDSISAVNAPRTNIPTTSAAKDRGSAKPSIKKTAAAAAAAAAKGDNAAISKGVNVDPAMLMRMKAGKNESSTPKNVQVDPRVLAKMKASTVKKQ